MAELGELGEVQAELEKRGGGILAVSVDAPQESRAVVARKHLPFPILSDAGRSVIQSYGLVHARGGPGGSDIAIPAKLLIDTRGRILWRAIAHRIQDRPDPADVLAVVRKL